MFDSDVAEKARTRLKDGLKLIDPHIFDYVGDAALDDIKAIAPRLAERHRQRLMLTVKLIEIEQLIEAYRDVMATARKRRDIVSMGIDDRMDDHRDVQMTSRMDNLWEDDAFARLEPERREFIEDLATRIEGKSPLEASFIILNLKNRMPKGRDLSKEETRAMINAFLSTQKEPEKSRFRMIFGLAGFK